MEILNILYNNNLIAVYLIGAILIIILIFIVISSINTTPKKEDNKILDDPTKKDELEQKPLIEEHVEPVKEVEIPKENKINDMVDDLYQKSLNQEKFVDEDKNLNEFLQEFDVPESVIEDVVKEDEPEIEMPKVEPIPLEEKEIDLNEDLPLDNPEFIEEVETPKLKTEETSENIESMLKRLYDLRQNEKVNQKHALINEIIELKKELDEALKSKDNEYELSHYNIDSKELADYYLFNKDIEFPKLK